MVERTKRTDIGLTVFRQGQYIGLRDGNGDISLSPELRFVEITPVKGNNEIFIAVRDDKYMLVTATGTAISAEYHKIEEAGEGYFRARKSRSYNLLSADGKEVLKKRMAHIDEVHNGFFIIGATERKTSGTSKTRHLYGLAHTDGTIVFSPIFEKVVWRELNFFYAEKDNHPYIIKEDGSIIDLTFEHLPVRLEVDQKVFVEKALNWILSGIQVYYRDSEAIIDPTKAYTVGKVIRAGFFVDVSTRLKRPLTKLRFLIFSAHVAPWDAINELVADNPDIGKWGFCTLHCNSYYIVLDIYSKSGVTQVSLLHIPPAVAKNIGESAPALMNIIRQIRTDKGSLVDISHKLLDSNLRKKSDAGLDNEYLRQCMRHPVGLNNVFDPVLLEPARLRGDAAVLGRLVSRLAKDGDIDNYFTGNLEDNFLWHGLSGSICEGCIYTKGIVADYRGCGRLTCSSFRRNYTRGKCEYRKPDISVYSQAEIDAKNRWAKYQEDAEKNSRVYAKNLVRKFIVDHLGGDIDQFIDFNFASLPHNSKFIDNAPTLLHSPIIRALMSLIHEDVWENLTYDLIERGDFECDTIHYTDQQLGTPINGTHFSGLQTLNPTEQQNADALELYNLTCTLGNFTLVPNRGERNTIAGMHNNTYYNGIMPQFMHDIYIGLTRHKEAQPDIKAVLKANGAQFVRYRGEKGFKKLVKRLMLDDMLDSKFEPAILCTNSTWRNPGTSFFEDIAICRDFFASMIPHRAARMVAKLKKILK